MLFIMSLLPTFVRVKTRLGTFQFPEILRGGIFNLRTGGSEQATPTRSTACVPVGQDAF